MEASTSREPFYDRLEYIQKQIDIIASRVSTLEEENKTTSNARDMPDSEGFWRDSDGDVWVRDTEGTIRLIANCSEQDVSEIYNQSLNFSSDFNLHEFGPYVKIDNPFI